MKKDRLLYVEWDDHNSFAQAHWRGRDEIKRGNSAVRVTSVGFVIAEDKKAITLCATRSDSDGFLGDQTILKNCIRKKRLLKV